MALDMIQYLYLFVKKKTFGEMKPSVKYKMDHRYKAFKKIRKFL